MNKFSGFVLALALAMCAAAHAKDPVFYQKGELVKMESVPCGYDEKSGEGFKGVLLGTDDNHKKTRQALCPEYIVQSEKVEYRIRPKEEKHPVLLPVGEKAEFRMKKDKMLLRVLELDGKEREYIVVSMTPREEVASKSGKNPGSN